MRPMRDVMLVRKVQHALEVLEARLKSRYPTAFEGQESASQAPSKKKRKKR
jgi:hypothetical protein